MATPQNDSPWLRPVRSVLFVSTADTARGPFAAAFAVSRLCTRYGRKRTFMSAGITAMQGLPAASLAIHAADRWGVNLRSHRSEPFSRRLFDASDLILTMEWKHLDVLRQVAPDRTTALITAMGPALSIVEEIPDPGGFGLGSYLFVFERIAIAVDRLLKQLETMP